MRWVFVHDLTGTHRDEYFFTTDVAMSREAVIETYTGRWNIETTFEEAPLVTSAWRRRGAGSADTVLRAEPCLFGLYTVVVLAVRGTAGAVAAGAAGGLAGQARRHVLGRDHGGTALAVGGVGFRDPRSSRGLPETRRPLRPILLNGLAPAA